MKEIGREGDYYSAKRLLHIVASSHGGGATHVRDLALELDPPRFTVQVAMPDDGGHVRRQEFEEAGIRFHRLDIAAGFSFQALRQVRSLASEVDLLHVHGARAALFGRLAAASLGRRRPRVVFSIHGFATPFYALPRRAVYLSLERALQRVTDCTICVSQAEADLFLAFGLTDQDRVQVIPHGIDVARFARHPADTTSLREELGVGPGPVLLTVCRLNVPRDFATLLSAFGTVRQALPDAHLLIVGDGPQRADVEALIRRLGLEHCARVTGYRRDVPDLMALADVYVLTSYGWEGHPISTLEAQAAGVPVVVTDAGGSGEAVQHEKTGLVVPKSDADQMAVALLRLLRDPDLRYRMGQAGRQRAQEQFARGRMVSALTNLYESLVQ